MMQLIDDSACGPNTGLITERVGVKIGIEPVEVNNLHYISIGMLRDSYTYLRAYMYIVHMHLQMITA